MTIDQRLYSDAGQSTNWFYIVDGLWAGYWITDTASIGLAP